MPDSIDREIESLEAAWEADKEEGLLRAAQAQRAHLEMRRKTLLNRTWVPHHRCPQCLRAILTMSPQTCCDVGKNGDAWWWHR
jgi:hypothetical protein